MIDNFYDLKNFFRFKRPPYQFDLRVKFPADDDEIFRVCQCKLCVIRILRTKWTAWIERIVPSAGTGNCVWSTAASL